MRKKTIFWMHLLTLASMLAACSTPPGGLWSDIPTPSPDNATPMLPMQASPQPSLTPTITDTPLSVLPLARTPTPGMELTPMPTLPPVNTTGPMVVYYAQSGETLDLVASRFGVNPGEIISNEILPGVTEQLNPGTLLLIPDVLSRDSTPNEPVIPDSEVVDSPSAIDFNTEEYVQQAGGYLAGYREYLMSNAWTTGAQSVDRIALDNSINPRILLGIIEFESHWVRGQPGNFAQDDYPLGYNDYHYKGLFRQMMWAVQVLSVGYYGWRDGSLHELTFSDGSKLSLGPKLNAGTVAIYYLFAQTRTRAEWEQAINPDIGFPATYRELFGDPWQRASTVEPLLPAGLTQPELSLPFERGKVWAFTGGPHAAWEKQGAMAALDFAPSTQIGGCSQSDLWVLAPAAGTVVRVDQGVVILDLDDDGHEQTGWALLFLHIADEGKVKLGAKLQADDKIGHPSCEGGVATGTHVHMARKYNGEWVLAGGLIPFNLDGWVASNGDGPYKGTLTNSEGQTITACTCGSFETRIIRAKQ